jgi:uncharacterized protein
VAFILTQIIKLYQFLVSPWLGKNCRFHPTCSEYVIVAINAHGIIKGLCLGFYRIGRCQPFCNGGYDPVPKSKLKI